MKAPYFLIGDNSIEIFKSIESLNAYVESPDLHLYKVYDSTGRVIELSSQSRDSQKISLFKLVKVQSVQAYCTSIFKPDELEEILQKYITLYYGSFSGSGKLSDLVKQAESVIGYS
jgi:hypothetical protein